MIDQDIRDTALYREAAALARALVAPRSGRIFDPTQIDVAPDGRNAVFTGSLCEDLEKPVLTRICHIDLRSGESTVLTSGPNNDRYARYSPDGRSLAFLSDRHKAGNFQLYLCDPSTQEVRPGPAVDGWVESTRSRRGSSRSGTSSRAPTTAARPGPSPGNWPTAGTSSTQARACSPCPTAGSSARSRPSRPTTSPGVWRYTGGALRSDDGGRTWGAPVISAAVRPRRRPPRHDVVGPADRPAGVGRARPVLLRLPPRDPDRRARSTSPGAPTTARPGPRRPRPASPARRPIPCPSPTAASRLPAAPRRDPVDGRGRLGRRRPNLRPGVRD